MLKYISQINLYLTRLLIDDLYSNMIVLNFQSNSPSTSETSQNSKKKQDPRKMWVQVKATGDMLEINLDKDRPVKFDSKDAEVCYTCYIQSYISNYN